MSQKMAAVAYIGSRVLQFRITEDGKENIRELEFMESPSDLGHQTFSTGRIRYESVETLCERINDFKILAMDYDITDINLFATTALRDAINRYYILDQIKIRTGLDVEIIEDAEEKRMFYDRIIQHVESHDALKNKNAVISYIGTGSIGATYYDSSHIVHTQNIPLGTLKLRESLGDKYRESSDFYIFMEEYLSNPLQLFSRSLPNSGIENMIVSGKQTDLLTKLFDITLEEEVGFISREDFLEKYDEIKHDTPEQIAYEHELRLAEAELLLPALCIYKTIFEMTTAKTMTVIQMKFSDTLSWKIHDPKDYKERILIFRDHTVASSRYMAQQYNYDAKHSAAVEERALEIFDEIKKIHGLGKKDRLLLQVAAIMHSLGEFEGTEVYQQIVYDMLKCFNIVGLRQQDMIVIAEASFKAMHHTDEGDFIEPTLSKGQQIKITKMAAILKVAEALDISRKQKFRKIDISTSGKKLRFYAECGQNFILEEWGFARASIFFRRIFGIEAKLSVKRCYDELS